MQDALDLIEFANGPVTSPWGKIRAQMGHPEPFHLTMMGVGNEQWGTTICGSLQSVCGGAEGEASGDQFGGGRGTCAFGRAVRQHVGDVADAESRHCGRALLHGAGVVSANTGRYDHYDRSGPKVFAGEYAAQTAAITSADNRNNWKAAIAEAAFMTGLERNGDVVRMASYAPLMAHGGVAVEAGRDLV